MFNGREAVVLTIWEPAAAQTGLANRLAGYTEEARVLDGQAEQWAEETAQHGAELAQRAGLKPRAEVRSSEGRSLWHVVVEVADAEEAAAIVLGARGLSPLRSMVLGSVSYAVVQHSERPVVTVR